MLTGFFFKNKLNVIFLNKLFKAALNGSLNQILEYKIKIDFYFS